MKDEIFENTSPSRMKSIPKCGGTNQEQNNVLLEQYEPEMR
jgi:cell division protein FtsL